MQTLSVALVARLGVLAALLMAGCGGDSSDGDSKKSDTTKKAPTSVKDPINTGGNNTSTGGDTEGGCGVLEPGQSTCIDGEVNSCTTDGMLQITKCKDFDPPMECQVNEGTKQAECHEIATGGGSGSGSGSGGDGSGSGSGSGSGGGGPDDKGPCGNNTTPEGTCEAGVAIWCNATSETEGTTMRFACADYGMKCEVNKCEVGAYCCNPQPDKCLQIGFFGECKTADTVSWCDGADGLQLLEMKCPSGKTCKVDGLNGAYCGSDPAAPASVTDFTTGRNGWAYFGSPTGGPVDKPNERYELTNSQGYALVSNETGDTLVAPYKHGIMKLIPTDSGLKLGFKWRARSTGETSTSTSAWLEVFDNTLTSIYKEKLESSNVVDTMWKTYPVKDLSSMVAGKPQVLVTIYLIDPWEEDYEQELWVDDISVQ